MMLAHALDHSSRGFRVFPLRAGGKLPAIKKWQMKATTDRATIEKLWGRRPYNVGIYAGEQAVDGEPRHLAVLDLDRKNGADGVAELETLAAPHGGLPDTWTTETPTGGRHLWFYTSRSVGSNAGVIAPGVDVRGVGGFVVAPGSTVGGSEYRVSKDVPIGLCPPWLEALLPSPGLPRAKAANRDPLPGIDPERAKARAIDYLTGQAPEAIEGAGGDHTTFVVAAKLKDLGVDAATAVELMLEHWFDGCGWSPDELATKVRNAYTYGANPPGADAPEAQFSAVPEAAKEPTANKYRVLSVTDLLSRQRPTWLVRGILPSSGLAVMYGPPASGKSFLALDLAAAIAQGVPWAGQRVKRGAVVYLALEGTMRPRVEAYLKANELSAIGDLHVVDQGGFDLLDANGKDVVELVAAVRAADVGSVALLLVDTLNRAMPGGNENASEDMGRAIRGAGRIASALGCLVMFLHHAGKDDSRGMRGHSSLLGAADAELKVSRGLDGETRYVRATKVKDGEDGLRFSFRLKGVDLGPAHDHDPDAEPGERDTSCVVDGLTRTEQKADGKKQNWTAPRTNAMTALRRAIDNAGDVDWDGNGSCTIDAWRAAFYEMCPLGVDLDSGELRKAKDARLKNFNNAVTWLTAERLVSLVKKDGRSEYQAAGSAHG